VATITSNRIAFNLCCDWGTAEQNQGKRWGQKAFAAAPG
jgi:hypothetical protein